MLLAAVGTPLKGTGGRVLASASATMDPTVWSTEPVELFSPVQPGLNLTLNNSGAWVYSTGFHRFDERQYAYASAKNIHCTPACMTNTSLPHDCCSKCLGCCACAVMTGLPQLARRVYIRNSTTAIGGTASAAAKAQPNVLTFGPIGWLATAVQLKQYPGLTNTELAIPTYDMLDGDFAADAAAYLHTKLAARIPPSADPRKTVLSERSLFVVGQVGAGTAPVPSPATSSLSPTTSTSPASVQNGNLGSSRVTVQVAMLVRDDATPSSLVEWGSMCNLTLPSLEYAETLEYASAHGQQMMTVGVADQCNWTAPVATNIPDSRSSTCAGRIAALNRTYVVGSQLPKLFLRDPLTLMSSKDGFDFDVLRYVRAGAPPTVFPGVGKGPGYEYPQAVVGHYTPDSSDEIASQVLLVAYSANKESIAVTAVPLESLR